MVDAAVESSYDDMADLPKLNPQIAKNKLVISSDRKCDETTAVVCLLKLKMGDALQNLIPDGMCSLCDFEEDVRASQEAIPLARAVIVLLSSGTLTSSLQLSIAAWATKARNASGTPDVIPVS